MKPDSLVADAAIDELARGLHDNRAREVIRDAFLEGRDADAIKLLIRELQLVPAGSVHIERAQNFTNFGLLPMHVFLEAPTLGVEINSLRVQRPFLPRRFAVGMPCEDLLIEALLLGDFHLVSSTRAEAFALDLKDFAMLSLIAPRADVSQLGNYPGPAGRRETPEPRRSDTLKITMNRASASMFGLPIVGMVAVPGSQFTLRVSNTRQPTVREQNAWRNTMRTRVPQPPDHHAIGTFGRFYILGEYV